MVPSMFPTGPGFEPSPAWGDEIIFDAPANPHNPMMDARGTGLVDVDHPPA